ncbi:phosphatase PAP2 family protein [Halobacterium salinarum]|uniref:phosphatase PAP2 family protein n=1 Tax=Halobacterium salinarum TaxID=2242 RepID=UPI002554B8AF|nr:phosphatase PAP2 family protein [Halobacterium salinarum]MDL0130670.1 phosphatase PAP2 family protein [Halobacterium salinarum]
MTPPPVASLITPHAGTPVLNEAMVFLAERAVFLVPLVLVVLWVAPGVDRPIPVLEAALAGLGITTHDGKQKSVFVFATIVVALAISYGMGTLHSHPAPYAAGYETLLAGPPENSFPSQHTTVMFAFAWPLASLQDRWRAVVVGVAVAALVGYSRVYVGVHYPVDIAGGIAASVLGFGAVYAARPLVTAFADRCIRVEARLLGVVFGGR